MAMIMPVTVNGTHYPEAYWRLAGIDLDPNKDELELDYTRKIAQIRFACYANQAAREASVETIIAKTTIVLEGDEFDRFVSQPITKARCWEFGKLNGRYELNEVFFANGIDLD
jgi:hypothetical protein